MSAARSSSLAGEDVGAVWGAPAPDADLRLPAPTGAGRLGLAALRPWAGVAVAVDAATARVAVALEDRVVLGALPDLGEGRALGLPDVREVAFVPGRRWLATAGERFVRVVALDRPRGTPPVLAVRTPGRVGITVSPGGGLLAVAGRVSRPRGTLGVWDLDRAAQAWSASSFGVTCAAWIDTAILAVGGRELRLFGREGETLPAAGAPRGEAIEALAGWPGGLVTAGRGTAATRWSIDRFAPVAALPVPAGAGRTLAVAGMTLAAGTLRAGGAVALVDLRRGAVDRVLLGVRAASWAGSWLVATGQAGTAVFGWEP